MVISFVLPFYAKQPVGGVKVVYEYANYLAGKGHQVYLYILRGKTLENVRLPANLKNRLVKLIIAHRRVSWFSFNRRVHRVSINAIDNDEIKDADVVIATSVETASPVANLNQTKGKKFYFIQDFENWVCPDEEVCYTYGLGMTNIVVADWLKQIVDKYSLNPSILISNSINTKLFKVSSPPELRSLHSIVFHYRKELYKGARYAIETVRMLYSKYNDLEVYVVSTNDPPDDLPECCVFLKNLSPKEVAEVNNRARVFICSSIEEGFGLPGLEAMACGCVLVSSKYRGVLEYAVDGKNALLSPIKDSKAMADNIIKVFENTQLQNELIEGGIETAEQRSLKVSGFLLEELLENQT